jgi:hypothetical protein
MPQGFKIIPIIFGKDCTIHPESLKFLHKIKGFKEKTLYEKAAKLLAAHYGNCKRLSTLEVISKLNKDTSLLESPQAAASTIAETQPEVIE